jgi:hypothetical protein
LWITKSKKTALSALSLLKRRMMNKVLRKRISNFTLIIAIVALGLVVAGAIALNRPLPEYLVAKSNLIPGEKVDLESFELRSLDLGAAAGAYVHSENAPESFYLNELVLEGELVPARKVSELQGQGLTTVVLNPSVPVSQKVSAGSWVQIWRSIPDAQGFLGELLITKGQVVSVTQDASFISDQGALVEVMVSQQQAALLLESIASDFELYVLVAP